MGPEEAARGCGALRRTPLRCALPHDEMSHSQFVYSAAGRHGVARLGVARRGAAARSRIQIEDPARRGRAMRGPPHGVRIYVRGRLQLRLASWARPRAKIRFWKRDGLGGTPSPRPGVASAWRRGCPRGSTVAHATPTRPRSGRRPPRNRQQCFSRTATPAYSQPTRAARRPGPLTVARRDGAAKPRGPAAAVAAGPSQQGVCYVVEALDRRK